MPRQFLSAQWRDLILASYSVDRSLLEPLVPKGLELDLFEGQAVCSLVGFMFLDTRVLGVPWLGYRNFPEINLRFYVREKTSDRRGVVFVRELVKSRVVAMIARGLYNEPYVKARITSEITEPDDRHVQYNFSVNGGQGMMRVRSEADSSIPPENTTEHWFKEHQLGYGQTRGGQALIYEVQHEHWAVHNVKAHEIEVDTAKIYGQQWAFLRDQEPLSVVHAVGSAIKVFGAQKLQSQAH